MRPLVEYAGFRNEMVTLIPSTLTSFHFLPPPFFLPLPSPPLLVAHLNLAKRFGEALYKSISITAAYGCAALRFASNSER